MSARCFGGRGGSGDISSARYVFKAEWRDLDNCIVTEFLLSYFISEGTIELYDVKKRRIFLKKCLCPNVALKDLFVGNTVTVMSRLLHIVDYGDNFTREQMKTQMQKTCTIIKPELVESLGKLLKIIQQEGFSIGHMRTGRLTHDQALEIYSSLKGTTEQALLVSHIITGTVVCVELRGNNAIKRWLEFVGPQDPEEARKTNPSTLSARFGQDIIKNGFYSSKDENEVEKLMRMFFRSSEVSNTATFTDSTCCIIKPHAVQAGLTGQIIEDIKEGGFQITAMTYVSLDSTSAEEFLEIYRGLLPEFSGMVIQLSSGPCLVLEVKGHGPETPTEFRELTGPADPEVARKVRPATLRAKFGKDKVLNAVHCTDLPEDAPLELEYFFKLLGIK